jgi:superfamily II DNA or RNA helicase
MVIGPENGWLCVTESTFDLVSAPLTLVDTETGEERDLFVQKEDGNYLVPRGSVLGRRSLRTADASAAGGYLPRRKLRIASSIELRDYQVEPVRVVLRWLRSRLGGVLRADGGRGKTIMGLEIARELGTPTVVMVHKEFLMEQWTERIQTCFPDATIGYWQGDRADSGKDCDFVIAMVQSLTSAREYPESLYKSFGLVIYDECHRYGAATWEKALTIFPAKYRLGLTGTPERADGNSVVMYSHIGPIITDVEAESLIAKVLVRGLSTTYPRSRYAPWAGTPFKVQLSKLITLMGNDEERHEKILVDILRAARQGRKCILLTDRLSMVDYMLPRIQEEFAKEGDLLSVARYVGGMKVAERAEAQLANVLLCTYSFAAEALDIPDLDTLYLATPKVEVTQACWRITRDHKSKKPPRIVDYVDKNIAICNTLFAARAKRYARLNYEGDY